MARLGTIKHVKEQEKIADARVQKRLQLRKQAKQTGALKNCKAFDMLADASIKHIIDLMNYEKIEQGKIICKQGEVADCMYLLMKGKVKITVNTLKVASLGKFEVFGESVLFASGDANDPSRFRSATVVAVGELEVLTLTSKDLQTLIQSGDLDEKCVEHLSKVAKERKELNVSLQNQSTSLKQKGGEEN